MDRLVVVKFHTNIANRWIFMIQRKIMSIDHSLFIIWSCLGGGVFPDTVYIGQFRDKQACQMWCSNISLMHY